MKHGYHTAKALCLLCSHNWVAVFPNDADFTKLECPSCHEQHSMLVPSVEADDEDPADYWKRI